jgi:hypothetical protein
LVLCEQRAFVCGGELSNIIKRRRLCVSFEYFLNRYEWRSGLGNVLTLLGRYGVPT